jgi:hypothetical protein
VDQIRVPDRSPAGEKNTFPYQSRSGDGCNPQVKKMSSYLTSSGRVPTRARIAINVRVQYLTVLAVPRRPHDLRRGLVGSMIDSTNRCSNKKTFSVVERMTMATSMPRRVDNSPAFLNSPVRHLEKHTCDA